MADMTRSEELHNKYQRDTDYPDQEGAGYYKKGSDNSFTKKAFKYEPGYAPEGEKISNTKQRI